MSKPIAVIGKLEDSPDWLDQSLVNAYLRTTYRVFSPQFDIGIGTTNLSLENWLSEHGVTTYIFVTAWNPRSEMRPLAENQQRNKHLETELRKVARHVAPAIGIGADGDWPPEESFWATDISPENAVRLGEQFQQNAIVWWQKGCLPALWWLRKT